MHTKVNQGVRITVGSGDRDGNSQPHLAAPRQTSATAAHTLRSAALYSQRGAKHPRNQQQKAVRDMQPHQKCTRER
jgi:hypothetical protein